MLGKMKVAMPMIKKVLGVAVTATIVLIWWVVIEMFYVVMLYDLLWFFFRLGSHAIAPPGWTSMDTVVVILTPMTLGAMTFVLYVSYRAIRRSIRE